MKQFTYKVYENDGTTLLATWANNVVINEPSFSMQINGGAGNINLDLALPFDDYGEGVAIDFGNIIKIYEIDENNQNGRLIYVGYISQYNPYFDGAKSGVKIEVLGLVSLLMADYYKNGTAFTVTRTGVDPTQIMKDIIDQANTVLSGTPFSYTGSSAVNLGSNVTYEYVSKKWLEALSDTFKLYGGGWFWTISPTGVLTIKEKPATATHTFTIGKDIASLDSVKDGEKLVNHCFVEYTGGDEEYTDATSVSTYGKRTKFISNANITDSATALARATQEVVDNKDLKVSSKMRVNLLYDIETIQAGDTCKIRNYNSANTTFTNNMLISRVTYTPNYVDIQLEDVSTFATELLNLIN